MTADRSTGTSLIVAPPSRPARAYVRDVLFDPACISVAIIALALGTAGAGPVGAMLALTLVLGTCSSATRSRAIRRHLDRRLDARARQRREAGRMIALEPAGPVRQHQYVELRELVAQIERADPAEARRFELQDVLDQFVRLAIVHRRCVAALELAGSHLWSESSARSARTREIVARRVRHRDECNRHVDELAEALETIDQLVRLIAQRVAYPRGDDDFDCEIGRRLAELDELDTALEQLST